MENEIDFGALSENMRRLSDALIECFKIVAEAVRRFLEFVRSLFSSLDKCEWCGNMSHLRDVRGNCPSCGGTRPPPLYLFQPVLL